MFLQTLSENISPQIFEEYLLVKMNLQPSFLLTNISIDPPADY